MFFSAFLALFRKKFNEYLEDVAIKDDVIFSPIYGKVSSINKHENGTEIKIRHSPPKEVGVYLPMNSELKEFKNVVVDRPSSLRDKYFGKSLDRADYIDLNLEQVKKEQSVGLKFSRNFLGSLPVLYMQPGDRGRQQVNIGYLPLWGVVHLSMPKNYEILIKKGDELEGGVTPIAGLLN